MADVANFALHIPIIAACPPNSLKHRFSGHPVKPIRNALLGNECPSVNPNYTSRTSSRIYGYTDTSMQIERTSRFLTPNACVSGRLSKCRLTV